MKRFIKQSLSFIVICIIAIKGLLYWENYLISRNANFRLPNNIESVIFGHSHSECAFNDSLIDNFKNLSNSGESYFYMLPKVKNVLSQNPQIKNVFIEFTNNQITAKMDNWIWGELMTSRMSLHSAFMGPEDHFVLIKNNCGDYFNSLSVSFKNKFTRINEGDYYFMDEMGAYKKLTVCKVDSILEAKKKNDAVNKTNRQLSATNITYLKKVIDYCESNDKNVFLVRSPQYDKFTGIINELAFDSIRKKEFASIPFLDFNKFELNKEDYADLEHLNFKGANKFSKWFDNYFKNNLPLK